MTAKWRQQSVIPLLWLPAPASSMAPKAPVWGFRDPALGWMLERGWVPTDQVVANYQPVGPASAVTAAAGTTTTPTILQPSSSSALLHRTRLLPVRSKSTSSAPPLATTTPTRLMQSRPQGTRGDGAQATAGGPSDLGGSVYIEPYCIFVVGNSPERYVTLAFNDASVFIPRAWRVRGCPQPEDGQDASSVHEGARRQAVGLVNRG